MDLDKTVMDTIHDEVPDWKNEEVRTLLGSFLFSGDTVFKQVKAGVSKGWGRTLGLNVKEYQSVD